MPLSRLDKPESDVFVCPACGALVDRGAEVCPECGSDDRTGWSEDADTWSPDTPTAYDDEFDYDMFVRREFGEGGGRRPGLGTRELLMLILAVGLCLLLLALLTRG